MKRYGGDIADLDPRGGKISVGGTPLPVLARQATRLVEGRLKGRKILIVVPTALEAEDLLGDLLFFNPGGNISLLPGLDRNPFKQKFSGFTALGARMVAARKLLDEEPALVVTSIAALLRKLPGPEEIIGRSLLIEEGEEIDFAFFRAYLAESGYQNVTQVEAPGDFSVRGGVVDIFPVERKNPVRLEFFGDFVESLRLFRLDDQRSFAKITELNVTPLSPVPLREDLLAQAASKLEKLAMENGWLDLLWEPIANNLLAGKNFADWENWSPLLEDYLASFQNFFRESQALAIVYEPGRMAEEGEKAALGLRNHFARLREMGLPHLPLETLYEDAAALAENLLNAPRGLIVARDAGITDGSTDGFDLDVLLETESVGDLGLSFPTGEKGSYLAPLVGKIKSLLRRGMNVNLVSRAPEQSRRLVELLLERNLSLQDGGEDRFFGFKKGETSQPGTLDFKVGELSRGFVAPYDREAFLTEEEIFRTRRARRRRAAEEIKGLGLSSLIDLSPGDYVVHADYGIGHYRGLENKVLSAGYRGDFLVIAYRGEDTLFVPVENFGLVSKYVGATDRPPPLDRLGSGNWEKIKAKVKEDIKAMAEELLKLYAERKMAPGFAFSPRDGDFLNFEAAFPYSETPDQEKAIEDVLRDLARPSPMDRLVCGDVGFGKTEVAIRAAYRVVSDGKQVAVLVPTTILAEQHERSFRERLERQAVSVASLSRFKKPPEQKKIVADLAAGQVDVIIGTHRLLSSDVVFKDLGLLVIDEEHRFGVADKEKLKKLRVGVDVLSMSATPIPRSLSMSMSGVRDLSIIQTPPLDRLSVRASLVRNDDSLIVEAIDRELARGGQVFFIHNRVRDIHRWIRRLESLMPLVRFGVGHGQMKPRELEEMARKFWRKEIDVWVSTTIVESGLDFPSANTIIIDQADRLGLAQLYQLKGRVGRGGEQAYAYLMVEDPDLLTTDARKRLRAIMENAELGSGYQVALHDLQIRGSGNVLGAAQSGQASLVGYEMYATLVERAVAELKNEPLEEDYEPEIVLSASAYLPEEYAPDTASRINLYRRLSRASGLEEIQGVEKELQDRFGPIPEEARNLLDLSYIKILAKRLKIEKLAASLEGLAIDFRKESLAGQGALLDKLLNMANDKRKKATLSPAGEFRLPLKALQERLAAKERLSVFIIKFLRFLSRVD
ncbi:MAG: transcription-repair coupling factor [Deltaproteobacteria bacterium]|jgi:transcription-repair coupling factor (superfamily II helicase)|nr:transcription-repair coupling factor [Deltaproteobacteria bacterium]